MLITIYIIEGESSLEGYGFDLLESGEGKGGILYLYQEIILQIRVKIWGKIWISIFDEMLKELTS